MDLIRRSKRTDNFTIVSNEIIYNKNLSINSRMILIYILSKPDDWVVHKNFLMDELGIGRRVVDSSFKELKDQKYLFEIDILRREGKFAGTGYVFYDMPQTQEIDPTDVHFVHWLTDVQNAHRTDVHSAHSTDVQNAHRTDVHSAHSTDVQNVHLLNTDNINNTEITNTEKKSRKQKKFEPPTIDQVIHYFKENGYSAEGARMAWRHYDLGNWHDTHGKPVKNWKQKMHTVWFKPQYKIQQQSNKYEYKANLDQPLHQ